MHRSRHLPASPSKVWLPASPVELLGRELEMFLLLARALLLLGLACVPSVLFAQASATASRAGDLKLGGGYTAAASDYGSRFTGLYAYGDFDFLPHLGVEAEFHHIRRGNGSTLYERTYEIGARYFRTYGILAPYAKVMVGRGVFNFPAFDPPAPQNVPRANLAYNIYALGAGSDVRVRPWLYLRGDYEYQRWPGFPPAALSPQLISFGAAYHFR